jgi:hypothetical protein
LARGVPALDGRSPPPTTADGPVSGQSMGSVLLCCLLLRAPLGRQTLSHGWAIHSPSRCISLLATLSHLTRFSAQLGTAYDVANGEFVSEDHDHDIRLAAQRLAKKSSCGRIQTSTDRPADSRMLSAICTLLLSIVAGRIVGGMSPTALRQFERLSIEGLLGTGVTSSSGSSGRTHKHMSKKATRQVIPDAVAPGNRFPALNR